MVDLPTGEWFFSLADVIILDNTHLKNYHSRLRDTLQVNTLILENEWNIDNESKIVAVYSHLFQQNIHRYNIFKVATTFLVHNSDATYDEKIICEWLDENPQITLYAQNLTFEHARAFVLPIGHANSIWIHGSKQPWKNANITNKNIDILKTFCSGTHSSRNQLNNLHHDKIYNLNNTNYENYVNHLCKSKYVICPPGNGPDTHRLWETLGANAIPIVLRTPFINQLIRTFPSIPLLVVNDFNDIDYDNLNYAPYFTPILSKQYWECKFRTPITFVHVGRARLPDHTYDAINQAKLWNPKSPIIVISSQEVKFSGVYYINCNLLNKTPEWSIFERNTKLDNNFRDGFWRGTTERIFALHSWMKQYEIKSLFHLENDNLLYCNIDKDLIEYFKNPMTIASMGSRGEHLLNFMLCTSEKLLEKFCNFLNTRTTGNEMNFIYSFWENNQNDIKIFPYRPDDNTTNYLIDAAPVGQFLGGPDPRNINKPEGSINFGFINENADFKVPDYHNKEIIENGKKVYYLNNKRLYNLHIHCKNLKYFTNLNKMNNLNFFDDFFRKSSYKTSHETLCNYEDKLIPGGKFDSPNLFYTHINYHTIKKSLEVLLEKNPNKNDFVFVETGCSAHGTKSTILWDIFVNKFGGKVLSVDLNEQAVLEARKFVSNKTQIVHSDSLEFLPKINESIDFLYLDSYDVDFLNPRDSAEHHLKEFNCVKHLLHKNSIILIDDTPVSPEWLDNGINNPIYDKYKDIFDSNMSGKGSLVNLELEKMGATKIEHQYQVLWII
jgi:hypothetical protein